MTGSRMRSIGRLLICAMSRNATEPKVGHPRLRAPRSLLRLGPSLAVAVLVLALFPASALAAPEYFSITGPSPVTTGVARIYTINAMNGSVLDTGYGGTATLSSTDSSATIPASVGLSSGTATFSAPGSYTISGDDGAGVSGTSGSVTVQATGVATHFVVVAPALAEVGSREGITATAEDDNGTTDSTYNGSAALTSNPGGAVFDPVSPLVFGSGVGDFDAIFSAIGSYTITATDGSLTGTSGALVIDPATPLITWANPADITYGTALGSTQLNATATVGGTTVPGSMAYTPISGTVLGAGTNQLLSVLFTPTDGTDYTTASATVHINVLQATPVITWSNPADITYGTALSGTQLNASVNVGGSKVYTPASGTTLGAGTGQALHVDFTPTDGTDYTTASATVHINVLQATPVITWSNPADITYGTALSGTQLNASVNVGGSKVYTPASGTTLGVGTFQALLVDFTPTDGTDYTTQTKTVHINVLQAGSTTVNVTSGTPSSYGVSVTFTATVTGAGVTPTGTVTFHEGGTNFCVGVALSVGGVATCATSTLGVGSHTMTATYSGDANYIGSSGDVTQVVNHTAPIITWANPSDITYGTALSGTQLNATSGGVAGSCAYSPVSGTVLSAGANQTLTCVFTPADLGSYSVVTKTVHINVLPRPITVTANSGQSKVYGTGDPGYGYSITSGSLVFGDTFGGGLTRAAGENVGGYTINQGSLSLSANYSLSYVWATFSITARPITVTANSGQSKVYGSGDPAYGFSITSGSLVGGDGFGGGLSRAAGENVGGYTINQGSLSLSGNYSLSFVFATFFITPATPTLAFTSAAPGAALVGGAVYIVSASSTSPEGIAFWIDDTAASVCSISGSTVSFIGVGTCTVDAYQWSDLNWNAALAQQSFGVALGMAVPGKPTGVTGVGFDSAAVVSWSAPADDGNSAITGYHVSNTSGGPGCDTSGLSCTVTGLTNHTSYQFTVTAINGVGWGEPSNVSAGVLPRIGASFVPLTPNRVLDTSAHVGLASPLTHHHAVTFGVTNQVPGDSSKNVPSTATAVTGVLTVWGSTALGYLALTPTPTDFPITSTLNFPSGDARSTGVTVPLSSSGTLSLTYVGTAGRTAEASLDITGFFLEGSSGATYFALTPNRILDSRTATGNMSGGLTAGAHRTFQVTGRSPSDSSLNVPSSAVAVTGVLTVTNQNKAGFLALGPDPLDAPITTSLFFPVGDNRATGLTVKLGAGGTLSVVYVAAAGAKTNVIFDVTGFFIPGSAGAMYVPVAPNRILDTRSKLGLPGSLRARVGVAFTVTGRVPGDSTKNIPGSAVAVTGILTVTNQTALGYLALTKTASNTPSTSTLNFPKGDNRATGVTVPLGPGGIQGIIYWATPNMVSGAIFDVSGYFVN